MSIDMQTVNSGKRVRYAVFGAFAGMTLCAALSAHTAKADFFDELFGFDQRTASPRTDHYSVTQRPRRQFWRARPIFANPPVRHQETARKPRIAYFRHDVDRHEESAGYQNATGSRPVKPAFCARESGKMSRFSQLLSDSTLRSGDIVATAGGLRIFHGDGTCPHKPRDFLALHSADLARGKLRKLAGLEVTTQPHGGERR
jgi:hypothetical protein